MRRLLLLSMVFAPAAFAQPAPLAGRLAAGDAARGEAAANRLCAACHSFSEGGPARVGPNLHGVVDAPRAHGAFPYSQALRAKGGAWTAADLDRWLADPRGFIPGTRMAFAGIDNPQTRADVILFLRSLKPESPP